MKKLLLSLLILPMLGLSGCGVEIVDAGHTGVKKVLGEVKETTYEPGLYFVNPFTTTIISMDNRVQRYEDRTGVYTKDVQQADVAYVVNFSLDASHSAKILNEVGIDYQSKVMNQIVTGSLKNVTGTWNAIELIANRQKASAEIRESIGAELKQYGITVRNFEFTDISYAEQFELAVEAKVTAVQKAEEAKNNTIRIQEEANQRIIAAEADAKAMQIKTNALRESQSLVLYEAVQKWDGILPRIIGGNGGSMLNVPADLLK